MGTGPVTWQNPMVCLGAAPTEHDGLQQPDDSHPMYHLWDGSEKVGQPTVSSIPFSFSPHSAFLVDKLISPTFPFAFAFSTNLRPSAEYSLSPS